MSATGQRSRQYAVISDSHCKHLRSSLRMTSYDLTIKAISGLKWCDYYNSDLSLVDLLTTSSFQTLLCQVDGILFVVGTNSVRIFSYFHINNQIKIILNLIRDKHPHLQSSNSIIISSVFPCFKTSRRFFSEKLLLKNIQSFNLQLEQLSIEMSFRTVNFNIRHRHIARDNIHVDRRFSYIIFDRIRYEFDRLSDRDSRR